MRPHTRRIYVSRGKGRRVNFKNVLTTAVVALVVVIGYDVYKAKQGN